MKYINRLTLLIDKATTKKSEATDILDILYEYPHAGIKMHDFAAKEDGYWLIEPTLPQPAKAHLVVFNHGYGSYNPMVYGKWIKHLVRQGNIVIYPRYQKNLVTPKADFFVENTAKAIRDAINELQKAKYPEPILTDLTMVGHSYGGTIAANLAVNYKQYDIPQPKAVMLCEPGTGPLSAGILDTYKDMPTNTKLVLTVQANDYVVGSKLAKHIFQTAIHTPNRALYFHEPDEHNEEVISARHLEVYAIDKDLDTGMRNVTAIRALKVGKIDANNIHGYWKILDELILAQRTNGIQDSIFTNKTGLHSLGTFSDGTPIKPISVFLGKKVASTIQMV